MQAAIVTSSYRGDFERCRLLCDSIDRRVTGFSRHYLLVEHRDVAVFRPLEGPRRRVVDERALLPWWLRPVPDPASLGRRRLWLSPFGPPLRGWHVQQLRRLAMTARMEEDWMLSCDSDVVFLKPFDLASLEHGAALTLYRQPGGITPDLAGHRAWEARAGVLLGLGAGSGTDYIATVIGWRRDTAQALLARLEAVSGRGWAAALVGDRALSECLLYGRFADEAEGHPERHHPTDRRLCHIYWSGGALEPGALADFAGLMGDDQVAIGIQSFTGTDTALIRQAAGLT